MTKFIVFSLIAVLFGRECGFRSVATNPLVFTVTTLFASPKLRFTRDVEGREEIRATKVRGDGDDVGGEVV